VREQQAAERRRANWRNVQEGATSLASGSITGPGPPPIQSRSAPLPRIRGSTLPSHPTMTNSDRRSNPHRPERARAPPAAVHLRAPRSSSVVREEEVRPPRRNNKNNNNKNNPPARSSSIGSRSCSRLQAPVPSTPATRTMSEIDSLFGIDGGDVDAGKCWVSGRGRTFWVGGKMRCM